MMTIPSIDMNVAAIPSVTAGEMFADAVTTSRPPTAFGTEFSGSADSDSQGLAGLVADNAALSVALQSLVDTIDAPFDGRITSSLATEKVVPVVDESVVPDCGIETTSEVAIPIATSHDDSLIVEDGRQGGTDKTVAMPVASKDKSPTEVPSVVSNEKTVNTATPVAYETPVAADSAPLVGDNAWAVPDGRVARSFVNAVDVPVVDETVAAPVIDQPVVMQVLDESVVPDRGMETTLEVAIPITTPRDDLSIVDDGRQGTAAPTAAVLVASNDEPANVAAPVAYETSVAVDNAPSVGGNAWVVPDGRVVRSFANAVNAAVADEPVTTPVIDQPVVISVITEPIVVDRGMEKTLDVALPSTASRDDLLIVDDGRQGTAAPTVAEPSASKGKPAAVAESSASKGKHANGATSVEVTDEVVLQATPLMVAATVSDNVTPVFETAVASVAPVSATTSMDVSTMFQFAAEEVAAAVMVSPELIRGEAGEIRVQLRPEVLEGSEVVVAVDGKKMDVTFVPTVTHVADTLVSNQSAVLQQLAMRISGFDISVAVAQTVATNVAVSVGSSQSAHMAVNRTRRTNGRA